MSNERFTDTLANGTQAKIWALTQSFLEDRGIRGIGDDKMQGIVRDVIASTSRRELAALAASPSGLMDLIGRHALPVVGLSAAAINVHGAPLRGEAGVAGPGGGAGQGFGTGAGSRTSARFDDLDGDGGRGGYASAAGISKMRELAISSGVGWAANHTELLRLGPSAIKALADVHLRQESFDKLKRDAGFDEKDVVTLAKFAKERGKDANKLSDVVAETARVVAGNNPAELKRFRDATTDYMRRPDDPEAQRRFREYRERFKSDPVKTKQLETYADHLKAQTTKEVSAKTAASEAKKKSAAAKSVTQNAYDVFNTQSDTASVPDAAKTTPTAPKPA